MSGKVQVFVKGRRKERAGRACRKELEREEGDEEAGRQARMQFPVFRVLAIVVVQTLPEGMVCEQEAFSEDHSYESEPHTFVPPSLLRSLSSEQEDGGLPVSLNLPG